MDQNLDKSIANYFSEGQKILASIVPNEVAQLAFAIETARNSGATVYIAGNGGSAATASHFATDIGVGSLRRANPVKAISLCDNTAVITALANDISYESIFEEQLKLLAHREDLLVVISASGNSENLIRAVKQAKLLQMNVFSLTGFDGGTIKELTSGANIHVQSKLGAYGLVEDAHLAICHVITECIRS